MTHRRIWQSATVAVALLTTAAPAHAYLDPSTASMVISAIVGLLASVSLALKTYWYKLRSFFRKEELSRSDSDADSSKESSADVDSSSGN